ncbi:pyridoxal phosphate-dependent aminotransferase [Chloroflexota bacterium]
MFLRPKPEIENIKVCPHGGIDRAELDAVGLAPEEVLDFSVCSNPFPPPSGVRQILDTTAINHYPDSEATELRQCLSEKLGVSPDNILAGNGAVELIRLIALTYFGQGDSILILEPTFGEYEVACQIVGSKVRKQWARAEEGFVPRIEETVTIIKHHHPKGVFICNPNNPTGQYLSRQGVEVILNACGGGVLILDEAYVNFVDENWSSINLISPGNMIIVRSMTKDYALAGLRLGYAIASQEIVNHLRKVRPPWNVNIVAQKAGILALKETGYLDQCNQRIMEAKKFLVDEFSCIGFPPLPSRANFFLVNIGNGRAFCAALLRHGILVRDCASFGLPGYVRIAPLTMPECKKLATTIKKLKRQGELDTNI